MLYRWRVKPGKEAQFVDAWSRVAKYYVRYRGSKARASIAGSTVSGLRYPRAFLGAGARLLP